LLNYNFLEKSLFEQLFNLSLLNYRVPREEPLPVPSTSIVAEEFGDRGDKLINSSSGPSWSEGE
jgi:hypothetical protein